MIGKAELMEERAVVALKSWAISAQLPFETS